jgi:hypothetical protein
MLLSQTALVRTLSIGLGILVLAGYSCTPEPPPNPYDALPPVVSTEGLAVPPLPEGNFAWLHQQILGPTCANSGCHDGTFEPDFRTVGSSWNTLVNHPVTANDAAMSFTRRVVPGNAAQSFLHERLTVEIPNTSGMMPLEVDQDSDYDERREEYIAAIAAWIEAGAPDINGNAAPSEGTSLPPQIHGFAAFPPGAFSEPYVRAEGGGLQPILVDAALIQIFAAISDDLLPQAELECHWALGMDIADADAAADGGPFGVPPFTFTAATFSGSNEEYGLLAEVDLSNAEPGSEWTLQLRATDGTSEIRAPSTTSPNYIGLLYRLRIAP